MNPRDRPILLAEDDEFDAEATTQAMRSAGITNPIVHVADGALAIDWLLRNGDFADRSSADPLFVVLDIKMPKVDGHEVLTRIRSDARLRATPVVMLTSSRHETDVIRSWSEGVNAYVVKPVGPGDYEQAVRSLGEFWARLNEPPPLSS